MSLKPMFSEIRGSVSAMAGVLFVAVIGVSALAVEYGHGLLSESENQRAADLAAISGAVVYNSTTSTTSMNSAVNAVATLNGYSGDATGSLVTSPSGDGNQAVKVVITTTDPLSLARVITASTSLPVSAASYAEIVPANDPGCIIALGGSGSGVTVTSASNITANNCAIDSNTTVTASSASTITTPVIDYGTTAPTATSASTIKPPAGKSSVAENHVTTADPLAGNAGVSAAYAHLGYGSSGTCSNVSGDVCYITSPAAPSVSGGTALTFNSVTQTGTLPAGCTTASHSGSSWTINCTGSGPYTFGALTVSSTAHVTINTTAGTTYNFNGAISVSSSASATFGAGNYTIAGGVTVSSSSSATFGAGTFTIGALTSSCNGVTGYSVCNASADTISFGGPSTFVLTGGIYSGSSAVLTMGSGTTNSYEIGKAADGNSIDSDSSSTTFTLAAATGSGDVFQTSGNIYTGSSSNLTLPATSQHDINGNLTVSSSSNVTLGAGTYTMTGYFSVASAATVNATGVTLVIGGANASSNPCSAGASYCTNSASNVTLTAPTSGTMDDLAVIGPPPGSGSWPSYKSPNPTAGAVISSASGGSLSGAVYFPDAPVTVSSASGLGGGSSACLELIGSSVSVSSASGTTSACTGLGGSSGSASTTITLVQ